MGEDSWYIGQYLGDGEADPDEIRLRGLNVLKTLVNKKDYPIRKFVWRYVWEARSGKAVLGKQGVGPDVKPAGGSSKGLKQE